MRRLPVLLLLAACGGGAPIPEVDLLLRVATPVEEVALGRAFPLEVVRVWQRGLEPAPWNARTLAPLAVVLEESERRDDGARVQETFRYRAYAFALDDIAVPAPKMTAVPAGGGTPRTAAGDPLRLSVRRALDADAPGPPELPGDPPARPFPWAWAVAALALLLAAAAWIARRRRPARAAPPAAPAPPPPSPAERALERLAVLRGLGGGRAFLETPDVVREYLAAQFTLPAAQRTTEELLTEARLAARARALLADVLVPCDLVKFAAQAAEDGDGVLDAAQTLVRETAA